MTKFILSLFFKTNLSAFRAAILDDDTNRICRILDVERDHILKELDNSGNTALLLAIKHASPLTVRVLLEQGANPDQTNGLTFQTPLSLLASKVYENNQSQEAKIAREMVTMLLDHGAFIDKPSPYIYTDENSKDYLIKETPLMTAVRTKNLPMATLFIEKKANVNYFDKQTENRPIHFAITNGDVAMFDLLENAGASCHSVKTNEEDTLLHWFCYNKSNDQHISLFKKLINKDCDVNAVNNLQRTPLMLATKLDMVNTCYLLLKAGADIDKIDYEGSRAIDFAKPDSKCFILLEETKAQSKINTDRVIWRKKPLASIRSLSTEVKNSTKSLNINEIKKNHYSFHISCSELELESDTKYKRMWGKLLQTKQKLRRSRDSSLHGSNDSFQRPKRDISQQRTVSVTITSL